MRRFFQGTLTFLLGFLLSFGSLHLVAYQLVDHFRIGKIKADLPVGPEREPLPLCINQPFYYLGKGSQSYVFESEDGEYVLKFFRMDRYRRKERRMREAFESCRIAMQELEDETGLLYIHLEASTNLHKQVVIHDALKRPYVIELDRVAFLVQKKGRPLYAYLKELIDQRRSDEVCEALQKIKKLLVTRFVKGVADHDPVIEKNAGFLGDEPLFLDLGQFYMNSEIQERETYQIEGAKVVRNLKTWLEKEDPHLAELFQEALKF